MLKKRQPIFDSTKILTCFVLRQAQGAHPNVFWLDG